MGHNTQRLNDSYLINSGNGNHLTWYVYKVIATLKNGQMYVCTVNRTVYNAWFLLMLANNYIKHSKSDI